MNRYRVIEFAELDSTNRYACGRLRELADGDVIQAGIQTAGRGRWKRKWISDVPGNLCLSLVLKPAGSPAELPLASLSQLLALSVCRVLETYGVPATLKWPNDIQVAGRKLAGILAETMVEGREFLGLVLGIGVNLNLDGAVLAAVGQPATALNLELGRYVSVLTYRDALLAEFFSRYEAFLAAGFPMIQADYRQRCPFLGRAITVRSPQDCLQGIARDITAAGELELELPDGQRRNLVLGEIGGAID
jgi:BirA family transcriptional regulator, biotin operon repressor / biotin---[acetyl-CoA-carboxylase] ligase